MSTLPSGRRTVSALALALTLGLLAACGRPAGVEAPGAADDAEGPSVGAAAFHHVHLNVTDTEETQTYYERFFGALPIDYRDRAPALFTERSFILLNEVSEPPPAHLGTTLWHIGWAGVHGPTEFDWRVQDGIEVNTPITPLGEDYWMYFYGPDRELVEVFTGSRNHRFEHVHLLATDVQATVDWFEEQLGLNPTGPTEPFQLTPGIEINTIRVGNVNVIIFTNPPLDRPAPEWYSEEAMTDDLGVTDGTGIDHIAFSFPDIGPVWERMMGSDVEIVRGIETSAELGLTSFFVRGPDGLLVEIVEARPIPEGLWR